MQMLLMDETESASFQNITLGFGKLKDSAMKELRRCSRLDYAVSHFQEDWFEGTMLLMTFFFYSCCCIYDVLFNF